MQTCSVSYDDVQHRVLTDSPCPKDCETIPELEKNVVWVKVEIPSTTRDMKTHLLTKYFLSIMCKREKQGIAKQFPNRARLGQVVHSQEPFDQNHRESQSL